MEPEDVGECNADAQAQAQCIIDNPKGACSEDFESAEAKAYDKCLGL